MAKQPGPPKTKSDAPAQFDMNSRERRGGKGGPGRRNREEKRAPSRIEKLPPSLVDRGAGWTIWKIGKVDQASHAPAGADYQLIFEGHEPLTFDFLSAARNRAKEPPPEKAAAEEVAVDETENPTVGETEHPAVDETPVDETPTDAP